MKKLSKSQIYNNLYNGDINKIDKNLSKFIKNKNIISNIHKNDPIEFEY